jgi:hypothetical protein
MARTIEHTDDPEALRVQRHPAFAWALAGLVAVASLGGGAWFVTHPEPLPTSDAMVHATTPVGQPVYVGMFTPDDFDRTLRLSGVKVHTTSSVDVDVQPLLCRSGTIGVTTDPASFCADLVDPEGESFGPGDSIVVVVTAQAPGAAVVDRVRLGYREALQADTQEAGQTAIVTILDR